MDLFGSTKMKLSNQNKIVEAVPGKHLNAFGNLLINSTSKEIHFWLFSIVKKGTIGLGIVEADRINELQGKYRKTDEYFFVEKRCGYALSNYGSLYSANASNESGFLSDDASSFTEGDKILMKLDLKQQLLRFEYYGTHYAPEEIRDIKIRSDIRYKMAVRLGGESKLELVNQSKGISLIFDFEIFKT